MEAVDGLSEVGHLDLAGVAVEDVEGHRRVQGVPQRDRLAEDVVGAELGAAAVPVAPFVDDEPGAVRGIVPAHDGPVVVDDVLDVSALVQHRVPAPRVEPGAVFGRLTEVGVVVQGEAVDPDAQAAHALQAAEEVLGPADVSVGGVPAGSGRHEERAQVDGKLRDEPAVFGGVFTAGHVAAAAPRLVADAPVLDVEGLPVAVGRALVGEGERSGRSVAVGHPVVELARGARADVGRDVGFGADQPAQAHELVNAELVALHRVPSGEHAVLPVVVRSRTLVRRTDAVAPVVSVGEAASGPAQVRRADALHVVHELLPDAVDVGDPRLAADPDAVVDDAAEVLDEVAVDVGADRRPGRRGIDFDLGVGGEPRARNRERADPRRRGPEEASPVRNHGISCSECCPGVYRPRRSCREVGS